MKIDRLYTLSQFVDYVKYMGNLHSNQNTVAKVNYNKILAYNEFLKQLLKKEMFVNDIKNPIKPENGSEKWYNYFKNDLPKWQEAEKKVIFDLDTSKIKNILIINKSDGSTMNFDGFLENKTLEWLSLHTNGQLKLKNVEI